MGVRAVRVLFVHHSFPGPFRHLAARLGAMPDTTVLFLSEYKRRDAHLPGVRNITVRGLRKTSSTQGTDSVEQAFLTMLRRGSSTANALLRLRRDGFVPDIIYTSTGMGHGFYLRDIFPEAFCAVHADWFHTKDANDAFFCQNSPRSPVDFARARVRNLYQLNALADCDLTVTSTEWQKERYPAFFSKDMHVLYEGVDTQYFSPQPGSHFAVDGCDLSHVSELVTFSGRSSEPAWGFPQFYRSLPRLLAARPNCHVLIMVGYPENRRENGGVAAREALIALQAQFPVDHNRVHLIDFRPHAEYRQLLRASTAHVYLTAPFALSSGLFEAMSCGCLLVGSDTPPVRELIRQGENGFLCDFWNTDLLADTVADLLARNQAMGAVRTAARQTIADKYDLRELTPRHLKLLLDTYEQWKKSPRTSA